MSKIVAHTDEQDRVTTVEVFYTDAKYVEKAVVSNERGTFKTTSIVLNTAVETLEEDVLNEIRKAHSNAEVRANRFVKAQ